MLVLIFLFVHLNSDLKEVRYWGCSKTRRKVAGSISDGVIRFFN
jgi:hypothetical protein